MTKGAHTAYTAAPVGPNGVCGAPMNVGAAGIYAGTLTNRLTQQENPVIAIIAENGDGRMSGQDGTYYRLNVATSGNNVSGSLCRLLPGGQFSERHPIDFRLRVRRGRASRA